MINVFPYESLGQAQYDWLKTHYHFSFADYYDPKRMGFGALRVINDDIIQPGKGFDMHPHRDMEIITYVTQGAISHRDNQGNQGRTEAGDVQVMTAGSGILHSEYNLEPIETKLFQIWIKPNKINLKPSWQSHKFPNHENKDIVRLLGSGDGSAPLHINQDAKIYAATLSQGKKISHLLKNNAYLVLSQGKLLLDNSTIIKAGDGVEITQQSILHFTATEPSQFLLIEV